MKIIIVIQPLQNNGIDGCDQYNIDSDYPNIKCDISKGIDYIKGSCLHCIGDWRIVPDEIQFEIVKRI
jgi:hypothetical protein